jgi:outer membrane protein assembly factor BamB
MLTPAVAQTMFRGNPAHTGVYATEGPKTFKGVKWAFKTGGCVLSSAAVADGVAYIGSDDKNLYALDTATGKEKWKFTTGGFVRSSPAVADGAVFFGSYDGFFYAVEAATGRLKWKFETEGERQFEARGLHGLKPSQQTIPDFYDLYLSSPVAAGGTVYFGSGDGHCYALDAQSGQPKWKFATGGVVHSSPALVDGTVYVGSWDSYFYALDAATGREKWKFKTGEDKKAYNQVGIQSSPAVVDGVVYFGCRDSHLYAVDAKTGQERWNFPNNQTWIIASPAIHEGVAYVGTSIPGRFFAIDLKSGQLKYQLDAKLPVFSSPAIAGGMAYFGAFNGKLYAVNLATGAFAWEFQTEAGRQNALGVLGPDGNVDPKTARPFDTVADLFAGGEKLFSLGSIVSSPTVVGGVIYVGSTDGNVYALE